MAKKNERNILFLDLNLYTKTYTPHITGLPNQFTLDKLMKKVVALREKNKVNVELGTKEPKELYISDMKYDKNTATWQLLINIVDTSLADEVHRKIGGAASTRKVNSKTDDVGTEFSSHVIFKGSKKKSTVYLALYEQTPNLPVKLIARYLNEMFKRVSREYEDEFKIKHPQNICDSTGKPKTINTYFKCHFNGYVSDQFKSDLDNGIYKDVKLITGELKKIEGYDVQKHTDLKEIHIPVKIDKAELSKAGGNHSWLSNFRRGVAKDLGMQELKVSFKDETDASHTANIDVDTGMLVNSEKYVKKVKISGFSEPLTTSVDLIYNPIIKKMLEHL
ncbi:hypothetical protein H5201_09585 [Pseudoalteromonas sp. SG43-6]|uniref:hypothetical protein n=1 Tax=Pseudoalteromonas sp. SG43-6 TaxID=2760967 RepID=UPI0016048038|nr:hypothetical protein [Pseudoalteromonas sp. SG43-6]MBB1434559.1 hypothetical protein [Pseudoalteromonas sp. SG43-6]